MADDFGKIDIPSPVKRAGAYPSVYELYAYTDLSELELQFPIGVRTEGEIYRVWNNGIEKVESYKVINDKTLVLITVDDDVESATRVFVSPSQKTSIGTAIQSAEKGANNGVATLDSGGDIPLSQLGNVPSGSLVKTTNIECGVFTGTSGNGTQNISFLSPTITSYNSASSITIDVGNQNIVLSGSLTYKVTLNIRLLSISLPTQQSKEIGFDIRIGTSLGAFNVKRLDRDYTTKYTNGETGSSDVSQIANIEFYVTTTGAPNYLSIIGIYNGNATVAVRYEYMNITLQEI